MRETREFSVDIGDIELAMVEWPGDSDPILLLHATGFHSRCWNQVVKHLPGQHIYAADLRFHGASGSAGQVDWKLLAEDIRILVERLDLQRLVGVGHSIGGHLIARAAAAVPGRFKHAVLVDPVLMSPQAYTNFHQLVGDLKVEDHPVCRRKNSWQDADEMYHRFCDKPPFDSWQPEVLRDYCDYALRPSGETGVQQLACDPINEASVYMTSAGFSGIYDELANLRTPVTLLRAAGNEGGPTNLSQSPTWPGLADFLPDCHEVYLPQLNHFIPMQDPQLVARHIAEAQVGNWS